MVLVAVALGAGGTSPTRAHPPSATGADSVAPRIVISIRERRLWVLSESGDTLLAADVAVGSGKTMTAHGRSWTFRTTRGESTVERKEAKPLWVPPDWHYYEVARANGLRVEHLSFDKPYPLRSGGQIVVRGGEVGVLRDGSFEAFDSREEIIRNGTLFIPPFGTRNRMVPGVLGEYRLVLTNGTGLHGTQDQQSIGKAVTHGCVRLRDDDIRWLYDNVPLGSRVLIY